MDEIKSVNNNVQKISNRKIDLNAVLLVTSK